MKIIIIGGGIGGMACAVIMARMGHSVELFEKSAQISEVGAGLQISPNGLAVLRKLGLEGALLQHQSPRASAISLRDYRRDGEVARLDLQALRPDQAYYFVHRADLISALYEAAQQAGVSVKLNAPVQAVKNGAIPCVTLENGQTIHGDLIVGADGVHSVARRVLNPESTPFFTKQVAWRAIVPNCIMQPDEARVYMGPGQHLVTYPLRGGKMINLVGINEQDQWQAEGWNHQARATEMQAQFHTFEGDARVLLNAVEHPLVWGLFRHDVSSTWHNAGLALLGDAAHPMLPFLAQGANMALEDAWVLGVALKNGALEGYQKQREARVRRVIKSTQGNAKRYHLDEGLFRFSAHGALKLASQYAPKLMLKPFDWLYDHDVTIEA